MPHSQAKIVKAAGNDLVRRASLYDKHHNTPLGHSPGFWRKRIPKDTFARHKLDPSEWAKLLRKSDRAKVINSSEFLKRIMWIRAPNSFDRR